METYFLTNPSFHLSEKDFLFIGNHWLYLRALSYSPKPTWVETISYRQTLFLLAGTHFSASGNTFLTLPQTWPTLCKLNRPCFRYFWRSSSSRLVEIHFIVGKKKYCFFTVFYCFLLFFSIVSLLVETII